MLLISSCSTCPVGTNSTSTVNYYVLLKLTLNFGVPKSWCLPGKRRESLLGHCSKTNDCPMGFECIDHHIIKVVNMRSKLQYTPYQ